MKFFKKFAAVLIAMAVFTVGNISILPRDAVEDFMLSVRAADSDIVASGKCGANLTWTLDSEGTLTISGEGEMHPYDLMNSSQRNVPWFEYSDRITKAVINEGVSNICGSQFYNHKNLISISIPSSINSIGSAAFQFCEKLSSIEIPSGVTAIQNYTFSGCDSITSIILPDTIHSIGYKAFIGCEILNEITIPSQVAEIGEYAFSDCYRLQSISIPDGVHRIETATFDNCFGLSFIMLSSSITYIGSSAFGGCDLSDIYYSGTEEQWSTIEVVDWFNNTLKSATLHYNYNSSETGIIDSGTCGADGDNLTWTLDSEGTLTISGEGEMEDWADCLDRPWHSYKEDILNITIENGVTSIGVFAFNSCISLTSISIPDSVVSIGYAAFGGCAEIHSIKLPDTLKRIEDDAFCYCDSLTSIYIPNSVTTIGVAAFDNCKSLTSITIPDSVVSIGGCAFLDCSSLTSITIPDSVESIIDWTFRDCNALTTIAIPNSITSIGEEAFENCDSLSDVYYTGTEEEWNNIAIESGNDRLFDSDVTIHYNSKIPDSEKQSEYQFFNMPFSWNRAKEYCESLNGHLAVISSAEEQAIIEAQIPNISKNCYWIGAYLENDEWKWVTDEPFVYENWGENLPDNYSGIEKYAHIYAKDNINESPARLKGEWNDCGYIDPTTSSYNFYSNHNFGFICEWENGDRELTGVIDFDVMQVAEFITNNPNYYLTSNADTEITTAKKAAITDPSVTDYLWWKDILGQNDNDYNAELAIEAIVAELVVSDDVVQGIEEAAKQAAEQAMNETLFIFAKSPEKYGIEGDELESLKDLVKTIEGGAVGVEFAAERSKWLSKFFKYTDFTTLNAQLGVISNNVDIIGTLYESVVHIANAPEDVYNLYISAYAYNAANQAFKDSLKLMNEYVQAEATIYNGGDDYSKRVQYVAQQFENCYKRLIDTSEEKYIHYYKVVCSNAIGDAIMDLTYEATTQLIICCVTLACPQLGAALETLKLTLEIGMNVWEALSEVDERALERDMFLNMIIFSDAIGKAMNDMRSGFPAVVLTVMDKHAIEMYQCGIKFYQKINNMMLEHAQIYLIMLRDDILNTSVYNFIILYVGTYGEEQIWEEYGVISDELLTMFASNVQGAVTIVDDMLRTMSNDLMNIISEFKIKQNQTKINPLSAVNIIEAGIHAIYAIHCPVDITITKNCAAIAEVKNDVLTVIDETSGISIHLIRTEKNELASKFVMLPKGYELQITGNGMGTMSLEKAIIENGSVIELSNLEEIPVTAGSVYNEVIEENKTVALECDFDNDGVIDKIHNVKNNEPDVTDTSTSTTTASTVTSSIITTTTTTINDDTQLQVSEELLDNIIKILDENGTTSEDIYKFVKNNNTYKVIEETRSLEEIESIGWVYFANYALNNEYVVQYYFAAITELLFQYAGYETRIVYGTGRGSGEHYWNQILVNNQWINYDTCNGYCAVSDEYLKNQNYTIEEYIYPRFIFTTYPSYLLGDVNEDGSVDSSDASRVLAEYAKIQTGGAGEFTDIQYKAADVNKDNVVDSSDASKILAYYAMISTGKAPTWD